MNQFWRTVALLSGAIGVAAPADAAASYKWKFRPLYVFAPDVGNAQLAAQRSVVQLSRGGLRDRDVVVIYVIGDSVSADLGAPPAAGAAALRSRYGIDRAAFRAVLVGKDGGVKQSSSSALTAAVLSAIIDAMPMRRQEVRQAR